MGSIRVVSTAFGKSSAAKRMQTKTSETEAQKRRNRIDAERKAYQRQRESVQEKLLDTTVRPPRRTPRTQIRGQCESDENRTDVVEKFENSISFIFHLGHLVIKLKYDPEVGQRSSLAKAKTTCRGREAALKTGGGGDGDRSDRRFGVTVNDPSKWMC
ncbi:hypothetical protein AVEN_142244-1 [Araneus ventricosus]|uniref:Uncharacterized protein n=1 Tax=Araneus ventricosus TaxID=182803 RepID=A0A4Y2FHW8_ARAVE|nr:hypothetical protein AVEN_142244-1 [Araneus ventricosus]